jgi:hypothetical protein
MRKVLVYIVLLMHINTFMFFPVVPDAAIVDVTDGQSDPINSALEYLDQIVLHHRDKTPENEPHGRMRYYHVAKVRSCAVYQIATSSSRIEFSPALARLKYIVRHDNIGPSFSYDIISPPPKVA